MAFFICAVPVCPIRAEASHRSEQVSQLLFGETCELIETAKDFIKIRVSYDQYEGWCQQNQLLQTTEEEATKTSFSLTDSWINEIFIDGKRMMIPFASTIPANNMVGNLKIDYSGGFVKVEENNLNEAFLKKIAFPFINTAYQWGGRSVFGIDCSGFSQTVFKCMNIALLRDASQQVTQGDEVGFLQEARCGDLAFFDNEAGKIIHVGILLSPSTIIHASGKVKIDEIDSQGIINTETGKRTHKLRLIKRITKSPTKMLF